MKLLLIGFSRQSAGALTMLANRNYPDCQVVIIDRTFCDNLRLCLPSLDAEHLDAKAMIINLDGVGMIGFSDKYAEKLQKFIGKRAVLLTTKSVLEEWEESNFLPKGMATFLHSPYNMESMTNAMKALMAAVPTIEERIGEFGQILLPVASMPEQVAQPTAGMPKSAIISTKEHFAHKILDKYFNIKQIELLHDMLDIVLTQGTIKVSAGNQVFYANTTKNLALVADKKQLMNYCDVVGSLETPKNVFAVESVTKEFFEDYFTNSPSNGYQKQVLSTLLLQIYSRILPRHIIVDDHPLLLKMQYMPNLASISDISDYAYSLMALALTTPRKLDEFYKASNEQVGKATLNRIFLLTILSGVADFEVLEKSFVGSQESATPTAKPSSDKDVQNQGVKKAQRSGFLGRLIRVLSGG